MTTRSSRPYISSTDFPSAERAMKKGKEDCINGNILAKIQKCKVRGGPIRKSSCKLTIDGLVELESSWSSGSGRWQWRCDAPHGCPTMGRKRQHASHPCAAEAEASHIGILRARDMAPACEQIHVLTQFYIDLRNTHVACACIYTYRAVRRALPGMQADTNLGRHRRAKVQDGSLHNSPQPPTSCDRQSPSRAPHRATTDTEGCSSAWKRLAVDQSLRRVRAKARLALPADRRNNDTTKSRHD